jgi:DnaK suppressor protein
MIMPNGRKPEMFATQVQAYKSQLETLRSRFNNDAQQLVNALPEEGLSGDNNRKVDLADEAEALDREITLIANEQSLCDEVDAALERIANGNYGKCTHCFQEIPFERLDAIPYAATCRQCAVLDQIEN